MNDQVVTILKALADPTRLHLVAQLARKNCAQQCASLSAASDLSQPAMSHHFAKLVSAGIVAEHKVGKEKQYELNTALLESNGIDIGQLLRRY